MAKKQCFIPSISIVIMIVCYTFFCLSGNIYEYTDNITVAVVTNGMYGNNFCQYLHPFFCLIIKVLVPLFPTADIFSSLIHLFLLLGIYLVTVIALQQSFTKPLKNWGPEDYIRTFMMLSAIIYIVLGMKLFGTNYTVQTSAIIMAGFLAIFYGEDQKKRAFWIVSGTILVAFGFMLRQEAALLFIPFIILEYLIEFFRSSNKKDFLKSKIKMVGLCVLLILIILGSKAIFYSQEPYASDTEYNKYRTIIEDYWMNGFDPVKPAYKGLDETTYTAAREWMLTDTDRLNTETLKKIANAGSNSAYGKNFSGVRYALRAMFRRITHEDFHLLIFAVILLLLVIWNSIYAKSIFLKLEAVLAFAGGFLILFYFTFMGRAPMRVWQCVFFSELTILIRTLVKSVQEREKTVASPQKNSLPTAFAMLFVCAVIYWGIVEAIAASSLHSFQTPLTAKIAADDSDYEETFSEDTLYIWPNWYNAIPDHFSKQNKLPTKRVIEHNIAIGDWVYGQTYFNNFLNKINAENPAIALLERPNTYLVEGQEKTFLKYMQAHYGEDITLKEVNSIKGRKVFQLVRMPQ